MKDFYDLPKRPCVRDSLLMGIGVGFALGGLRLVFRCKLFFHFVASYLSMSQLTPPSLVATIWKACNLAAGSFCASAGIQYQYCLWRRQQEKEGMMRAVEILNKKEAEKKAREEQRERAREERRRVKEEEQEGKFQALRQKTVEGGEGGRSWWKVW